MGSEGQGSTQNELELDAALLDVIDTAQRACPTFRLPGDVFAAYLRERLPADVALPIALRQMHAADLYLACACALGDARAIAAFDERCLSHLDRAMARMGIDQDMIEEIKQDIRRRVLTGDGGRAEIVDFCGRGDLRGWIRVMATRQAMRSQSRARREVPIDDDELLQQIVACNTPELDCLKSSYRREFKQAFEAALRALPDREQTLLRQHHVDSLTLDEIAGLYRVHRATAARMLARARTLVMEATRERLMSQLDVPSQDLDSILRMIWSQVEISLRALQRGRKR
jgi:RNA polymerase sigma-70 factor, ECF subfamily